MSNIILVDDEVLARDRLRRMLEGEKDYEVIAEAANGDQAISLVQQYQPDILLMDIRMPGMDGLEAAQHLSQLTRPPAIVFCTAYDEYAINAFDVQAVGYVLKPVRKEQLLKALERAKGISNLQLKALPKKLKARTHLSAKTHVGVELMALVGVSHFVADQKYVTAHYQGRQILLDEPLKQLEQEFGQRLLRIHRNCLVSLHHVERLIIAKQGQSSIKLKSVERPLTISRRHLPQVKKVLKSL